MSEQASTVKQTLEINKLRKRLRRNVGQAIADYKNSQAFRNMFYLNIWLLLTFLFILLKKILTALLKRLFQKEKLPVVSALAFVAVHFMVMLAKTVSLKSPWVIIAMILSKPHFSICFMAANLKPCHQNY